MCMRIRLNNDKVIVGQGSGCSVARGDVKENRGHYIQTLREVPATTVGALKKELDDWKRKIDSSAVETALSSLQMMISRPVALFDTYAVIAALDEVVNVGKDRATRFEIVLRQCHSLINNPALQQILIKLVASKEEAEVAKFMSSPVPLVNL